MLSENVLHAGPFRAIGRRRNLSTDNIILDTSGTVVGFIWQNVQSKYVQSVHAVAVNRIQIGVAES